MGHNIATERSLKSLIVNQFPNIILILSSLVIVNRFAAEQSSGGCAGDERDALPGPSCYCPSCAAAVVAGTR